MRSRRKGGGGLRVERESNKVMVRHGKQGNREGHGTAGACEDKVELGSSPVGRRGGGEC